VSGGRGVSVVIRNNGSSAFSDVPYSIVLDGGIQLKTKELSGTLLQLLPGASTLKKLPVLGLGTVTITVTVDTIQVTRLGLCSCSRVWGPITLTFFFVVCKSLK